jgi:hypothetical protein
MNTLLLIVALLAPAPDAPPAEPVAWERPCEINPWQPPPPIPPEDGSEWCWVEVPELV